MKRRFLNAILTLSLPCLLCLAVAAQQPTSVAPGQSIQFSVASNADFTSPNLNLSQAGAADSANYVIRARASSLGSLLTPGAPASAFAFLYNEFKITGNVARVVNAQVSANAEFNGQILAGGLGASASVRITLTLVDVTSGFQPVAETVILESSVNKDVGQDPTLTIKDENGSRVVNIQSDLVRGRTYRLIFRIDCSANGAVGSATSEFFSNRRAKLSNLTVQVGADTVELLEMIKTGLSALTDEVATIKVIVQNTNTLVNQRLDVAVSTRASQVSVNNVQNTVNVINAKVDDLADKLMKFQADSLRSAIEAALVEGDRYNVAWYQTPTAANGRLDLVREIVQETINNAAKAGAPDFSGTSLDQARAELALGDVYRAANGYKDAYDHYRAAYLHLSIVPGNHRP